MGEVGIFQFLRVGGGHGVHRVGAQDRAFEKIHIPIHHQRAVVCPALIQTEQIPQTLRAVASLILDVVDGQNRADGAAARLPHAVILQVDGDQGGLPVVAVDHVRPEVQMLQHPHHGAGEKAEALPVVHIAVQIRAAEVLLVIQKIPRHAVLFHGKQAAVCVPPRKIHIVEAAESQLPAKGLFDPLIQGQDHRRAYPLLRQSRGERACYIGKPPGFAEGNGLAGRV